MSTQLANGLTHPSKHPQLYRKLVTGLTMGNVPNFREILKHGTQLSVITRDYGIEHTTKIIGLMINDFCNAFNVVRPMTEDQIIDTAIDLATEYWNYKLEDFAVFFHLCRKETYDRILDRLDPGTINRLLKLYEAQRSDALLSIQLDVKEHEPHIARLTPPDSGIMTVAGTIAAVQEMATKNTKKIEQLNPGNNGKAK